jgi:hypothetical protein
MSSHRLLARFLAPASALQRLSRQHRLIFRSFRPSADFSRAFASARPALAASAAEHAASSTSAAAAAHPVASDGIQVESTTAGANQDTPQNEAETSKPADTTIAAAAGTESASSSSSSSASAADDAATATPIGHSLDTVGGPKLDGSGSGSDGSTSTAQASSSYVKVLKEIRELRNRSWRFLGSLFALLGAAGALVYLNWDRMLYAFGRHGATVAQVNTAGRIMQSNNGQQ